LRPPVSSPLLLPSPGIQVRSGNDGREPVWDRRFVGKLARPTSGEWERTFAIITTDANEVVAEIHDRMPLILAPGDYTRWPSDEPDLVE
jgi:putative SOS response-associated peptidase YedK